MSGNSKTKTLTIESKEQILLKPCIRVDDVILLTGYSKSNCYNLMQECRKNYKGHTEVSTSRKQEVLMKYNYRNDF